MKNRIFSVIFFAFIISGYSNLHSESPIYTVVPFLTIAPDSRAGAMGDVGVATSPDIFSMHWNPAKFAFIDGDGGAGLSYIPWLRNLANDINIANLSWYTRLDAKQVISASLFYSSLGNIQFTDDQGYETRKFNPNEFAVDGAYSRKLTDNLSGGIAFRIIYSNLTGGTDDTKPGFSVATDISGYYQKEISILKKKAQYSFGLNLSNIGNKMNYSDSENSAFIPMNMRLGTSWSMHLDDYNEISLSFDLNKLLVPTPPTYGYNSDSVRVIISGKDPDVAVPVAIFQSFYDAPGGFKEELHEIMYSIGAEYWYNKQFALRAGYFHENVEKGNRRYFTAGAGFRLKVFTIDFSYLIATQNHPLAGTLRFSLSTDFNALRNASRY